MMGLKATSLSAAGVALLVGSCGEIPPMKSTQNGYRGVGIQQISNPRIDAKLQKLNVVPPPPYALEPGSGEGERANQAYQNVQVLGDLSVDEFNHLMASITEWVAPAEQGCNYCHNPENMASDAVYTKIVSRRMLQMTRNINVNWKSHVQNTGVTCWTCHRGNAVPKNVWYEDPKSRASGLMGNPRGQNQAGKESVRFASLPYDAFTPYLLKAYPIRVQARTSVNYPEGPIKATEATYGLMMHMSGSLGVNCSYCHNSRAWADWSQSSPQRVTAWYGIRMVRDVNNNYIQNLGWAMPVNRKGPLGDPYKVNCTTCHQGVAKPLYGVSMLPDHPQLRGPAPTGPAPMPKNMMPKTMMPKTAAAPMAAETAAATPAAPVG